MAGKVTTTLWMKELDAARLAQVDYQPEAYKTINGKLDIAASLTLNSGEYPENKMMMIGNKGMHTGTVNGSPETKAYEPSPLNAVPFGPMPVAIRDINDGLTAAERERYRLRTVITLNGETKEAWYGLVVEGGTDDTAYYLQTWNGTSWDEEEFEITDEMTDASEITSSSTVTKRIVKRARVNLVITAEDAANIIDAQEQITGSRNTAVIQELCLCSCFDREISSSAGGVTVNYTEAVKAQMMTWASFNHSLIYDGETLTFPISLGTPTAYDA